MKLPIMKALKNREYQSIASFQDVVVGILYKAENRVVLHGGTVIWRCFSGNRFSSDIDAYMDIGSDFTRIKDGIIASATDYGVQVGKIKNTGNLIFMGLSSGGTYLKVEINHKKKSIAAVPTRFERADGTFTDVLTLSPERLMLEKISAYSDRRFIRDIYDLYILSDYVTEKRAIKKDVSDFLKELEAPVNEEDLRTLIYQGPVPSFRSMIDHIRGRFL